MSKRLTTEYVRGKVEEKGWVMKDKVYVNARTKMNLICPNGHGHRITWGDLRSGYGCPHCYGNAKHDIEYIREQFAKKRFILKSTKYVGTHSKLDYVCPNGHEHSMAWNCFLHGKGCPYCAGNAKYGIDYAREQFEKRSYVLDSDEYVNSKTKLNYTCPNGHKGSISLNSFQQGRGCKMCAAEASSVRQRLSTEYVRVRVEERGWTFDDDEYLGANVPFNYTCDKGHKGSMQWLSFQQGRGCRQCVNCNIKYTIEHVREKFEEKSCILKSTEYINKHTKLDYICPKGHEHSITFGDFIRGYGCSTCWALSNMGSGNPNWKGGCTKKQYCDAWFDKEYRLDIKERDGYRCQNPYCKCNGGVIAIHHMDYSPMNCHPSNLIILCQSCHGMSNWNRDWHELYFKTLMNKKYGYVY